MADRTRWVPTPPGRFPVGSGERGVLRSGCHQCTDAEGSLPSASGIVQASPALREPRTLRFNRRVQQDLNRSLSARIVPLMMQGQRPPAIDLDRLRSDLAEARERVRDLEQLIILAERWYGREQQMSMANDVRKPDDRVKDKPTPPMPLTSVVPAEGPLVGLGAREAAVQLLKTTGTVWRVDAATQEMLKLGWQTNSPAPETVVRSAMMRDKRIERVAPGEFRYRELSGLTAEASPQHSESAGLGRNGQVNNTQDSEGSEDVPSIAPGSLGHRVGRGEDACHGGEQPEPAPAGR
jgi:hypothetical protein